MSHSRVHLVVNGEVQGVCYRASAREEARALGLTGFVRNLPDGRVEAVAEGARAALETFLEWCRRGPPYARVEGVAADWSAATGEFGAFTIVR